MSPDVSAVRRSTPDLSGQFILRAVIVVFRMRPYRYLATTLFLLFLAFYVVTLPAKYTGGAIGLVSLRYLSAGLTALSVVLALLLSLAVTLNLHAFRASLRRRSATLGVSAVLASLVPTSMCCTSLVPSVLAALGASTPQIFALSGRIQGTVTRAEPFILALSVLLLLLALRLAAGGILGSCPQPEGRDIANVSRGESRC